MTGKRLTIRSDGASLGNPGPAAIGVVVEGESGAVLSEIWRRIGETTNNRAEYIALIAGLEQAAKLGAEALDLKLDSQLIVRQLKGEYRSKELTPLYQQTLRLLKKFKSYTIEHVPGWENRAAHALAKRALRSRH
jgi:ribonuclease HI